MGSRTYWLVLSGSRVDGVARGEGGALSHYCLYCSWVAELLSLSMTYTDLLTVFDHRETVLGKR